MVCGSSVLRVRECKRVYLDILADLKDGDSYGATRKQARE
jgi:hypothetical protein